MSIRFTRCILRNTLPPVVPPVFISFALHTSALPFSHVVRLTPRLMAHEGLKAPRRRERTAAGLS